MCSVSSFLLLSALTAAPSPELRVCADPNNLPFSNVRGEGFENALAHLVAADLGRRVRYVWWPQRRGFVRHTLGAGVCDVVMGVPAGYDPVAPTRPYYRSSYVFVSRRDRHLGLRSLDDPRLHGWRIALPAVGDDYANVPPAQALARRGLARNIVGISLYGDYGKESPPSALIQAVAEGRVDVAIAWGPLAGYYAARSAVPLEVLPLNPFVFDIAMGVRRDDTALRAQLDAVLERRKGDVDALLRRFHVPLVPGRGGAP
ncbi:MAG TPA: substrate-binding domain-containing protein [Candidatus Polarisedimenticolaceae bacterium]|nr:substrate-binding domain-containing protein [Candidatus Polarisedimenticolaceae bacterium]